MIKPTKVLCKKTLAIGDDWEYVGMWPPRRVKRDNRMIVEGDWYDVIYNPNDGEDTFTILDHQKNPHLFCMYESDDLELSRTYKKWFYTLEELREMSLTKLGI